jgi:hypothetical protein
VRMHGTREIINEFIKCQSEKLTSTFLARSCSSGSKILAICFARSLEDRYFNMFLTWKERKHTHHQLRRTWDPSRKFL